VNASALASTWMVRYAISSRLGFNHQFTSQGIGIVGQVPYLHHQIDSGRIILDSISGETAEVKTQLGNLYDLIQEHG